jgi:hypothetical protein
VSSLLEDAAGSACGAARMHCQQLQLSTGADDTACPASSLCFPCLPNCLLNYPPLPAAWC